MTDLESRLAETMRRYDAAAPTAEEFRARPAAPVVRRLPARRTVLSVVGAVAATVAVVATASALTHRTDRGPTGLGGPAYSAAAHAAASAYAAQDIVWTGTDRDGKQTTYRAHPAPLPDAVSGEFPIAKVEWRGLQILFYQQSFATCKPGVYAAGDGERSGSGDPYASCPTDQAGQPNQDTIVMAPPSGPGSIDPRAATTPVMLGGEPALIGTEGRYTYLYAPSRQVVARLSIRAKADLEAYVGASSIRTQSSDGCPLVADGSPPVNTRPGTDMVPAGATSVTFCSYAGTDFSFSHRYTDRPSDPIRDRPAALSTEGINALSATSTSCTLKPDFDLHVYFRYPQGGPPVEILVRATSCYNVYRFSNGSITRYGDKTAIGNFDI